MDYYNSDLGAYTREHEARHQQQQVDATAQPAEAAIEQVEQTNIIKTMYKTIKPTKTYQNQSKPLIKP